MPKSWVNKHNLKKGDTISVEEGSGELVFYAGEKELKSEEKSISINAENKKLSMLKAEIVSAYLNNYNTIEIFSKTLENDAPVIKGILRNLSGMEIIEQTGSRIVAKDLIDISSILIQSIIRRMDVITRAMIDDTMLCMGGKCSPKSISHRDTDVNRLYYLGFRAIKNAIENPMVTNKLKTTTWRLSSDREILYKIEEIADVQKRISRVIAEVEHNHKNELEEFRKALEELKELNDGIKQRYYNAMKAYYTNDKKLAYEIETTNKDFIEKCDNFLKKITKRLCSYCLKTKESNNTLSDMSLKEMLVDMVISVSKIIEYKKATVTFIRGIVRTILDMD